MDGRRHAARPDTPQRQSTLVDSPSRARDDFINDLTLARLTATDPGN